MICGSSFLIAKQNTNIMQNWLIWILECNDNYTWEPANTAFKILEGKYSL